MKHQLAVLSAVFVGGMSGTALRWGADILIPHGDTDFPMSTLLVNVVGAFALGLVVARFWTHSPDWLKAGLGSGLLGSFTTFSALMVSLVALGSHSHWWIAALYLALSLILGLGAAALGLRFGKRTAPIDWVDE